MSKSVSKKPNVTPDQFKLQMGKCLYAWQMLEQHLFDLFLIATQIPNIQVCSAVFSTIKNVAVKGDMVDSAISAALEKKNTKLLKKWGKLYAKIGSNASLRNRVVHNHLINFADPGQINAFALVPHIYKIFYDYDTIKTNQKKITYQRLLEIEKGSQEITVEILSFEKDLELELAKESS